MTAAMMRLKKIEEWIAMQVCLVHGVVTKADIDALEKARQETGMTYDAINCKFSKLEVD